MRETSRAEEKRDLLSITGELKHILFQARDSSYTVGIFKTEDGKVTACGSLPHATCGQVWNLEGDYVDHARYGRQFRILSASLSPVQRGEHLIAYFAGEGFEGIGVRTAEKIVSTLGEHAIEIIQDDPQVLIERAGLSEKQMEAVMRGINTLKMDGEMVLKLISWGLSTKAIAALTESGKPVRRMLENDCFSLLYEIPGFGYDNTIRVADGMQIPYDDLRRLMASIYLFVRETSMQNGDTYLEMDDILREYGHLPTAIVQNAVESLVSADHLEKEGTRIYPWHYLYEEKYAAAKLALMKIPLADHDESELDRVIENFEHEEGIEYDPLQKQAIEMFFKEPVMILNGGPGTGKSTVVKGIVRCIRELFPACTVSLCAPTGRAAKRLTELTGVQAKTIHSMLGWDMEHDTFVKDDEDPLDADFLIVDEFSMVPQHVFTSLLKAVPRGCRLLMIGDEDQLESVAPGKVFADLIHSGSIAHASLQTLFRQAKGSGIARMARQIREEEPVTYEKECAMHSMNAEEIIKFIQEKALSVPDLSSFQILAPKYAGSAGIDRINMEMQKTVNPFAPEKLQISRAGRIYRQGDRVMLKKNMPDQGVFNGDIGEIVDVDPAAGVIEVEFDDAIVEFENDIGQLLSHAWCVSIHKAQGSEYRDVCLIVSEEASFMFTKKLLYTGISRAKRQLDILGSRQVFEKGIRISNSRMRRTTLKERIRKAFS